MPPYLALTFGILSRLVPSLLHLPGHNLTAAGASLLFFGARRSRREIPLAALAFAVTDVLLTTVAFHTRFRPGAYLLTWLWYLLTPLFGRALLRPKLTASPRADSAASEPATLLTALRHPVSRAVAAVLGASGSFFLLSNGSVWLLSRMYPHTAAGLLACYAAGLPFLRNDLLSTTLSLGGFLMIPASASLRARLRPGLAAGSNPSFEQPPGL